MHRFLLLFFICFASKIFAEAEEIRTRQINPEKQLLKELFINYDPRVRPVWDPATAVAVKFGWVLTNIKEGSDNIFEIQGWPYMSWYDEYLRWDPEAYNGIKKIKICPRDKHGDVIWLPDILAFRAEMTELDSVPVRVQIGHDGHIWWFPRRSLKLQCSPKSENGTVLCPVTFGSWVYHKRELDLHPKQNGTVTPFLSKYSKWTLIDFEYHMRYETYTTPTDEYPIIKIQFTFLKKKYV